MITKEFSLQKPCSKSNFTNRAEQGSTKEIPMGQNTSAVTDTNFQAEVLNSSTPVLVDFWAEWCGPCRALGPKLEEIAGEMAGKVRVVKLNVDENPQTPGQYGIRGIPAMLLFKDGKQVGELVGNHPKDNITEFLKTHTN